MKGNAILRIVLFSLAILVLIGILIAGFATGFVLNNLGDITDGLVHYFTFDEEVDFGDVAPVADFDPSEIRDIEIDWAAGSITIIPSDTANKITVSETEVSSERHRMNCNLSGDKLVIDFSDTQVYIGISFDHSKDLVIEVPRNWICDSLEIDAASARVDVHDLTIHEFDFDGASGVCNIINCNVDEIDLDTASGDVNFVGTLDILNCDAASASCRITVTNVPRSIDIDTASGDLDLTLPDNCGFSCNLTTLSGGFSSDFTTVVQNGYHVHGDGSCRINVRAMSGDVTIRKNGESAVMITEPMPDCTGPTCTDESHGHNNHH